MSSSEREQRVTERGEALAAHAVDLAADAWPNGNANGLAEALEYLVEAIIQFAIHHKDPKPVIDLVVDDLRGISAEQLSDRRDSAIARLKEALQ